MGLVGLGTLLIILNPDGDSIRSLVTPGGIGFGLLSAVAGAYYSVRGGPLVRQYGPGPVTTWGLVVGGMATFPFGMFALSTYMFPSSFLASLELVGLILVVIVLGTLLGYGLYLFGLRDLPATEAGVVSSYEPISAGVASYVLLGIALTSVQYLGGALILVAVVLLGYRHRQ